jgi:hypothetical protein
MRLAHRMRRAASGAITPLDPAWSPISTDPMFWLDAQVSGSFSLTGDLVNSWADLTTNGFGCSESGSARPQLDPAAFGSGLPGVQFGNGLRLVGDVGLHYWRDIFVVSKWAAADDGVFPSYNGLISGRTDSYADYLIGGDIGKNKFYLITDSWFPDPGEVAMVINAGAVLAPFPSIRTTFMVERRSPDTFLSDGYQLGDDRVFPNRNWQGPIAEVLGFNYVLDTSNRQKIEGYLAHKWEFVEALPSDHPYKTTPP